jgi:hypothetical protein
VAFLCSIGVVLLLLLICIVAELPMKGKSSISNVSHLSENGSHVCIDFKLLGSQVLDRFRTVRIGIPTIRTVVIDRVVRCCMRKLIHISTILMASRHDSMQTHFMEQGFAGMCPKTVYDKLVLG